MPYPLIILGAGASCGYSHEKGELTFPLVKDLGKNIYFDYVMKMVERNDNGSETIEKLKGIILRKRDIVTNILSSLQISDTNNLEGELERLWNRALKSNDQTRQEELKMFSYFLQLLFHFLSQELGGFPNNYKNLRGLASDFLEDEKESYVCVVSFNYDTLANEAFKGINRCTIKNPHGSCEQFCVFLREKRPLGVPLDDSDENIIPFSKFVNPGEAYPLSRIDKALKGQEFKYAIRPALISPIPSHKHLVSFEDLNNIFSQIDRILIIGWRGVDESFVKVLVDNVRGTIPTVIVAKNKEDVEEVERNLTRGYIESKRGFDAFGFEKGRKSFIEKEENTCGFSSFVGSESCRKFFQY